MEAIKKICDAYNQLVSCSNCGKLLVKTRNQLFVSCSRCRKFTVLKPVDKKNLKYLINITILAFIFNHI